MKEGRGENQQGTKEGRNYLLHLRGYLKIGRKEEVSNQFRKRRKVDNFLFLFICQADRKVCLVPCCSF